MTKKIESDPGSEFLFELLTEEIPAAFLPDAITQLEARFGKALADAGLSVAATLVDVWATPRRLVLHVRHLPTEIPARSEEITGPPKRAAFDKDGQPTRAATGFAASNGVDVGDLRVIQTEKGEYMGLTRSTPAVGAAAILAEIVPAVLSGLSWRKTMRWGSGEDSFVRPVHGVIALLDGEVVPMNIYGVASGAATRGHRAHGNVPIEVQDFSDYRQKLEADGVVIDPAERRTILVEKSLALALEVDGRMREDERLLAELAHLTEHPGLVRGQIREVFLALPEEILVKTIRHHQKSFVVETTDGAVAPYFLAPTDHVGDPTGKIARGNEWVIAARLADAVFFLQEDRKVGALGDHSPGLSKLAFHDQLGSYAEKADRLEKLAGVIASELGRPDLGEAAQTAARLAKADLVTEMVREFTDLEGVVGGLYAQMDGLDEAVWQGIYDHYRPKGEADALPRGEVGAIVALADKLDSLTGFFGLGLLPTGSKDPFALRRHALGIMRILLEQKWDLILTNVVQEAAKLHSESIKATPDEVVEALLPFLEDRFRHLLEKRGHRYDEIAAVLASGPSTVPDLAGRIAALGELRDSESFRSLVLAFRRIVNITKDDPADGPACDPELFEEEAEAELAAAVAEGADAMEVALGAHDPSAALAAIAALADPLDRYFQPGGVLVNCEDQKVRENRHAFLSELASKFARFAVFSEVVAEKAKSKAPSSPSHRLR